MPEKKPSYRRAAVVTGIHDGDTVHICLDLGKACTGVDQDLGVGLHIEKHQLRYHTSTRLRGVNAPELATAAGKIALGWVKDWFAQHCYPTTADGKPGYVVMVTTERDEFEKYGRLLVSIEGTKKPGSLNDDLLTAGMAVTFMAFDPNGPTHYTPVWNFQPVR